MIRPTASSLAWLLDPRDAPSRYLTLRELSRLPERDPRVAAARRAIPSSPWVRRVLRGQRREGYSVNAKNCYLPKLNATVWRLQLLAELGMSGEDVRVRRACERFLWQNTMPDGGFTCGSPEHRRRFSEECVAGHMTFTLLRLGYARHPKVRAAVRWLLAHQRPDGGWNCDHRPTARHSSFLSTLAALKGLSAASRQTPEIRRAVARGVYFLLAHELFWSHRRPERLAIGTRPFALRFPAHYAYDLLQAPRVLALLGHRDGRRIARALDLLEARADARGRWKLDRVPLPPSGNPAYALRVEREGRPSKWLTLHALAVLRRFGRARLPEAT